MKESLWDKDGMLFKFNYGYSKLKPEQVQINRCHLLKRTFLLSPVVWLSVGVVVFIFLWYCDPHCFLLWISSNQ